mmetsp:Transcript_20423/g.32589  ORF Transcript_20423/g.32589 Transcript_20423/m.32589 type:complete len:126 (+) Transcript_20423:119-496(+)
MLRIVLVCAHWAVVPLSQLFEQADPHSRMVVTNIMHCALVVIDVLYFEIGIHRKVNQIKLEVLTAVDETSTSKNSSRRGRATPSESSSCKNSNHKDSSHGVELACMSTAHVDDKKSKDDHEAESW